ncbi:MAG TPA: ParB/RepB/Spo0J family partition protein [Solirubrobacteraceae bacterium]|nr:ParB/RepB/Spo0J family partition protein [Solirubrobacteraceae bacterium]
MATAETQVEVQETESASAPAGGELMMIPLSKIKIVDGFNPRDDAEKAEIDQLARSIKALGVLQPILVRPADESGDFPLTAGERRTRAAAQIGLLEIPALVRVPDERTDGLDDAIAENLGSVPLNPLQEAHAFKRLRDRRLTAREIATRVPGASERVVRERLRILDLPEELWPKIVAKTIPLGAVETLSRLAKIHADLPPVAVSRVLDGPYESWDAPTTWSELNDDPISVLIGRHDEQAADLPDDVYVASVTYPVSRFALSDDTVAALAEIAELRGFPSSDVTLQLHPELVEQAVSLGAVHPADSGHAHLIVGQEVADQLAADTIARHLAAARAVLQARAGDEGDDAFPNGAHGEPATPRTGAAPAPVDEEALKTQKREQRAADLAARAAAAARNDELGIALVKHLSKVKIDARVMKILTSVDLVGGLERLATRGARYGFPGWVTETPTKTQVKREYLSAREAATKAKEFLEGAKTSGEIAGRCLALVAMARHADETAVAPSSRSTYGLTFSTYSGAGLPWTGSAEELLDELLIDMLPEKVVKPIREARDKRAADREEAERIQRQRDALLLDLAERAATMTRAQRQTAIVELRGEHGYGVVPHGIGDRLIELAEPEAPEPSSEVSETTTTEPVEEPVAQAA